MSIENYTTISTSKQSAKLAEPITIEHTGNTRKVLFVDLNTNKVEKGETVGVTIVHQRKNSKEIWEDVECIKLNSLKGGEGVKLHLDSKTTKVLFNELRKLYALVDQEGVQFGTNEFTVAYAEEIIKVSKDRKIIIEKLLAENFGEELWAELVSSDPDLATRLSFAKIQSDRVKALEIFKENLDQKNGSESFWQSFFESNQWIFGYGLNYKFLHLIIDQPYYGGTNYSGKGAQRGDYLMSTKAEAHFTVLVEIKTPVTNILSADSSGSHRSIRSDTWLLSSNLLGSISQLQVNTRTWSIKSQQKENSVSLEKSNIYTVEPKGILVIGCLSEFENNESKLNCFEIFRRNIHNPEIMTFDELYERAKFIVFNNQSIIVNIAPDENSDLPF